MSTNKSSVKTHRVKANPLQKNQYRKLKKLAFREFLKIKAKTKRKPYIKSSYFKKQKVFFDYFWVHLFQKTHKERINRMMFFPCGFELLYKTTQKPLITSIHHKNKEIFYRFYGTTKNKQYFAIQDKRETKGSLQLMSIFPIKKSSANLRL